MNKEAVLAKARNIARERFTPAGRRESFQRLAGNVFAGTVREAGLHHGEIQPTSQGFMKFRNTEEDTATVLYSSTLLEITRGGQPESPTYRVVVDNDNIFAFTGRRALHRINKALIDLSTKEPSEMV